MVVMGILNITPDSFSDGGMLGSMNNDIFMPDMDKVLYRVSEMINDGAGIIDVGGESTRPGYSKVDASDEIERIAPVIESIKSRFDTIVSVDTYKSTVAKQAVECGADIVNDIGGFTMDDNMGTTVASLGVPYVLTYNGYSDNTLDDINKLILKANEFGINKENIIIDPGVGFGKTADECFSMVKNLDELCKLNVPVLLGTSRKSFIAPNIDKLDAILPEKLYKAVSEYSDIRLRGTLISSAWAVKCGASYIRVHDIKENVRIVSLAKEYYN